MTSADAAWATNDVQPRNGRSGTAASFSDGAHGTGAGAEHDIVNVDRHHDIEICGSVITSSRLTACFLSFALLTDALVAKLGFMPKIVGIHGIAQQYKGGNELRAEWLPALKDGLEAAGRRDLAEKLAEEDLRVSFFGSLFRPPGAMGGEFPPFTAADLTSDAEVALLDELYDRAAEQQPELGKPAGALGPVRVRVQIMVERLLRSRTFAGLAERALVGNFKQVTQFLDAATTKDKVLARVGEQIGQDTRIVIGHSLGSVVAYEYLCRHRPPTIELFVTLGSPLGIPNVIFHRLTPTPVDGRGAWPAAVTRWVNVADPDDVVALRKQLEELFPPPTGGVAIVDELVDNGDEPHAIRRYLNAKQTGAALAAALTA